MTRAFAACFRFAGEIGAGRSARCSDSKNRDRGVAGRERERAKIPILVAPGHSRMPRLGNRCVINCVITLAGQVRGLPGEGSEGSGRIGITPKEKHACFCAGPSQPQ